MLQFAVTATIPQNRSLGLVKEVTLISFMKSKGHIENIINFQFILSSQSILTEVKHMGNVAIFFFQKIVLDFQELSGVES